MSSTAPLSLSALVRLVHGANNGSLTNEQSSLATSYGIIDSEGVVVDDVAKNMAYWVTVFDADTTSLNLNSFGNLDVVAGKPKRGAVAPPSGKEEMIIPPVDSSSSSSGGPSGDSPLSKADFIKALETMTFALDNDKITTTMSNYLTTIPQMESYTAKEIPIFLKHDSATTLNSIIAAGTKILDAFVYISMIGNPECQVIFDVKVVDNVTFDFVQKNINDAREAFIALVVIINCRGNMPSVTDATERPLIKLLREGLFGGRVNTEQELAGILSSASSKKFPAKLVLKMDIAKLPEKYFHRALLSSAGGKAIRYAVIAAQCAKRPLPADAERLTAADLADRELLKKAHMILSKLASQSGNAKGTQNLHPLKENKVIPAKFTLKCTAAILYALSPAGRKQMVDHVNSNKIAAFMKDVALMGVINVAGVHEWPVLQDPVASFAEISEDTLNRIFTAS